MKRINAFLLMLCLAPSMTIRASNQPTKKSSIWAALCCRSAVVDVEIKYDDTTASITEPPKKPLSSNNGIQDQARYEEQLDLVKKSHQTELNLAKNNYEIQLKEYRARLAQSQKECNLAREILKDTTKIKDMIINEQSNRLDAAISILEWSGEADQKILGEIVGFHANNDSYSEDFSK